MDHAGSLAPAASTVTGLGDSGQISQTKRVGGQRVGWRGRPNIQPKARMLSPPYRSATACDPTDLTDPTDRSDQFAAAGRISNSAIPLGRSQRVTRPPNDHAPGPA